MKIFEIIPQLSSGGAERFTVDLCNELSKQDEVYLIVLHSLDASTNFYIQDLLPSVHLITFRKGKGASVSVLFKIANLILKIKPDIVHTHLRAIIYVLLSTLLFRNVKFFHTVHNDAEKEAGDSISTWIRKFCFKKKLIKAITISKESQRSFAQFYNLESFLINNGRNVPNKINVSHKVEKEFEKYKFDSQTRVLINLARIDVVKRQTMLAKIVSRLNNEGYTNFSVLLIGSTKYLNLVDQIKSFNCHNVFILGERKNPLEYLAMADAYCLCSTYEGMPISLIEALGAGIIPICTPVGGVIDVIDNGHNGLLAENLSEDAYYNVLKSFLELPKSQVVQLSIAAKDSYLPYSMTECAKKYVKLFNQK